MYLKIKEIFFHSWKRYLICFLYGILIIVIYNSLRNWDTLLHYIDGLFIAGASLICIGGLSIVNSLGTFDVFSHLFAKGKDGNPKPTFAEYVESNKVKHQKNRFHCVPYFVFGLLYFISSLILQAFL